MFRYQLDNVLFKISNITTTYPYFHLLGQLGNGQFHCDGSPTKLLHLLSVTMIVGSFLYLYYVSHFSRRVIFIIWKYDIKAMGYLIFQYKGYKKLPFGKKKGKKNVIFQIGSHR